MAESAYSQTVEIGGVWENSCWEVHHNVVVSNTDHSEGGRHETLGVQPCPHAIDFYKDEPRVYPAGVYGRQFEAVEITTNWTVPRVIVQYNEGGHSTTGVCLDCVLSVFQ